MNKEQLTIWNQAINEFKQENYDSSKTLFKSMLPQSRIYYNLGVISILQRNPTEACEYFQDSVELDKHFSLAYFQLGLLSFNAKEYFLLALEKMRSSLVIDYKQLGLDYELKVTNILFRVAMISDKNERILHMQKIYLLDPKFKADLTAPLNLFQPKVGNLDKINFLGERQVIFGNITNDWSNKIQ